MASKHFRCRAKQINFALFDQLQQPLDSRVESSRVESRGEIRTRVLDYANFIHLFSERARAQVADLRQPARLW